MTDLEFNTIKEEIYEFKDKRVSFVETIREEELEKAFSTINKLYNYSLDSNDKITKIKIQYVNDYIIFEFDKVSYKTNKTIKNIGISLNKKPVFLTSCSIYKSDNIEYTEESFGIYNEENGHIASRIKINNTKIDGLEIKDIEILNKAGSTDFDYNRKSYTFYNDNGSLLSLKENEELYTGNNPRVEVALRQISKVSNDIRHGLDVIVGKDSVKEYSIKRKGK